jgi:hypothetical protein
MYLNFILVIHQLLPRKNILYFSPTTGRIRGEGGEIKN